MRYFDNLESSPGPDAEITGPYRILDIGGRVGVNTTSIHSRIILKKHLVNHETGSLGMWVCPLEDLASVVVHGKMKLHNEGMEFLPFLSDNPNPQDYANARFKFVMQSVWHPSIQAMFSRGKLYEEAYDLPHRALVTANHFTFEPFRWYHLVLTWNHPWRSYGLYVNGIRVGSGDRYHGGRAHVEEAGEHLYTGNPALVYSTIEFHEDERESSDILATYRREAVDFDPQYDRQLRYIHAGSGRKPMRFRPDASWKNVVDLSLTQPGQMDAFYVQGCPVTVAVTGEGLLVETVDTLYTGSQLGNQVYLWLEKFFEGDLYVEYEFQTRRRGGLSLLITQATGMNGEDFMADYPRRTSGRMTMVCWEDVRNYHWEYYRDMADVRNDVLSSALMKNPFMKPLDYGCLAHPIETDTWHKLQFLKQGSRILAAINGVITVEAEDDGQGNDGPVLNSGRVAIRAMLRTKMLFRNLKIFNKQDRFRIVSKHP